mgnify:FL=1|tara:strand:- start:794 stop:1444 length:651 start_codon:yes stop_codon:yes gene_type:complete
MANATNNTPRYNTRTLSDFKSRLVGGGARPNLFECVLAFPQGLSTEVQVDEDFTFMVKAAQLPASNVNVIDIPFRGRNLKVAGDRTFDPWTITVINDTNFKLRNAFERWMNFINRHDDNAGVITPAAYQTEMVVHQLGRGNETNGTNGKLPDNGAQIPVLKTYKFFGTFPTNVSPIELSYDAADSVEEFTVDLQVQWWDALDPESGSSILGTSETT